MTLPEFKASFSQNLPQAELSIYLKALWYDGKGNWRQAHSLVDHLNDETACWVHAYLHRKEGDNWNAGYWYRRAGKNHPSISLQEEWQIITEALL